jgi:hypothetical protein
VDTSAPAETDLGRGVKLPGLTIVSAIHVGERSIVYLAYQDGARRDVVVKVLRAALEDPAARSAFRRDARAASRLHPAIASVYAAGLTPDGQPFVVMEVLAGGSLEERLNFGEELTPESVRDLGIALADALSAAHDNGVVHGEIDPSHVLFTASGAPKLAGFGLSGVRNEQTQAAAGGGGAHGDVQGLAAALLRALQRRPGTRRPPSALATGLAHMLHEYASGRPEPGGDMTSLRDELVALRGSEPASRADVAAALPSPVRVLKDRDEAGAVIHDPAVRDPVAVLPRRRGRALMIAAAALMAAAAVGLASYSVVTEMLEESPSAPSADRVPATAAPATTAAAPPTTTAAPPATTVAAPPTTTVRPEVAPATTVRPAAPPATPAPPVAAPASAPEEFVRRYYDGLNAEDYARGWAQLSDEFRSARGQTYDSYVRYWQSYDVSIDEVSVVSTPGPGTARVRVSMQYLNGDQRVAEVDELTVRQRGDGWEIVDQTVVG